MNRRPRVLVSGASRESRPPRIPPSPAKRPGTPPSVSAPATQPVPRRPPCPAAGRLVMSLGSAIRRRRPNLRRGRKHPRRLAATHRLVAGTLITQLEKSRRRRFAVRPIGISSQIAPVRNSAFLRPPLGALAAPASSIIFVVMFPARFELPAPPPALDEHEHVGAPPSPSRGSSIRLAPRGGRRPRSGLPHPHDAFSADAGGIRRASALRLTARRRTRPVAVGRACSSLSDERGRGRVFARAPPRGHSVAAQPFCESSASASGITVVVTPHRPRRCRIDDPGGGRRPALQVGWEEPSPAETVAQRDESSHTQTPSPRGLRQHVDHPAPGSVAGAFATPAMARPPGRAPDVPGYTTGSHTAPPRGSPFLPFGTSGQIDNFIDIRNILWNHVFNVIRSGPR